MAGEAMDIETAEQRLKAMDHSEQHYFNRYDLLLRSCRPIIRVPLANEFAATTTMVSESERPRVYLRRGEFADVIAPSRNPRRDVGMCSEILDLDLTTSTPV